MAEASLDVLMMQELTEDATSIDAIQAALQSSLESASNMVDNVAKIARIGSRRIL